MRFLADENFDNRILRSLIDQRPSCDVVRLQDTFLRGAEDPHVLEWAATQRRVLLTHDQATIPRHAYDRVRASLPMPGVLIVTSAAPIQQVVSDLLLFADCAEEDDVKDQVRYLPL